MVRVYLSVLRLASIGSITKTDFLSDFMMRVTKFLVLSEQRKSLTVY